MNGLSARERGFKGNDDGCFKCSSQVSRVSFFSSSSSSSVKQQHESAKKATCTEFSHFTCHSLQSFTTVVFSFRKLEEQDFLTIFSWIYSWGSMLLSFIVSVVCWFTDLHSWWRLVSWTLLFKWEKKLHSRFPWTRSSFDSDMTMRKERTRKEIVLLSSSSSCFTKGIDRHRPPSFPFFFLNKPHWAFQSLLFHWTGIEVWQQNTKSFLSHLESRTLFGFEWRMVMNDKLMKYCSEK